LFVLGIVGPGAAYSTIGKAGKRLLKHLDLPDKLNDTFRLLDKGQDIGKGSNEGADLIEATIKNCLRNSFSGETLVATESGPRPISTIAIGDRVLAYDEDTGVTGLFTVTDVLIHVDPVQVHLTIDGEHVETTPEHPFFTLERGWVDAGELRVGERVRRANGFYGLVQAVVVETEPQVMYNLTVAEAHTFFVGAQHWLVHNTNCNVVVKAINAGLPNRNGVGKTSGYLFDSNGNMIGDIIVSGHNKYSRDSTLVRGHQGKFTIQDHVEAQAAGIMRDNNISDATLVINNHPCSNGINTCQNLLPNMVPEGSNLRVIVPDGYDSRGAYEQVFTGVP
jgi:hypothetical protein